MRDAAPFGPFMPSNAQLSYAQRVRRAVMLARAAMAAGTPRAQAARQFDVPLRLWSRL